MSELPHAPPNELLVAQALGWSSQGVVRLSDVSFCLHAGERLVVLGPNGAGKSLLLRRCHGLLPDGAGRVRWRDPALAASQSMVFQRPVLLKRSVGANVALALRGRRLGAAVIQARVRQALAEVALTEAEQRPARALSGGEQQRVALARARVTDPAVIWLDEPTAHLDPASTRALETALLTANAQGTTLVMATHDIGQARRLATRVLFMLDGRLLCDSEAAAFFAAPPHPAARQHLAGELAI